MPPPPKVIAVQAFSGGVTTRDAPITYLSVPEWEAYIRAWKESGPQPVKSRVRMGTSFYGFWLSVLG